MEAAKRIRLPSIIIAGVRSRCLFILLPTKSQSGIMHIDVPIAITCPCGRQTTQPVEAVALNSERHPIVHLRPPHGQMPATRRLVFSERRRRKRCHCLARPTVQDQSAASTAEQVGSGSRSGLRRYLLKLNPVNHISPIARLKCPAKCGMNFPVIAKVGEGR